MHSDPLADLKLHVQLYSQGEHGEPGEKGSVSLLRSDVIVDISRTVLQGFYSELTLSPPATFFFFFKVASLHQHF